MNDSFPPQIDGVATAVINYADIISHKYGNAVVAVPQYPGVSDKYPFEVIRYPSINTTKFVGYRAGYPFSASALYKLETKNIDIIHSHCPVASNLFARMLRESIDVPVVFTYHTKFDIDIARAIKSEYLQQAVIKRLVYNIEACDEVWAVSKGAGENLRSLGYEGEYIIMENGVDFPCGRIDSRIVDGLRKSYRLPDEVPVFMFVGRMMWYKGIRIILDGLKRVKGSGFAFKMFFVGDGADRLEIEQYAAKLNLTDDCIFTGAIQNRELLRTHFCMADLFLFPSTFDTNGIVVREAAACGLASVLIGGSSAAEGITDGQNGICIDENPESMAEAIAGVCNDRRRIREIGRNAMNELYLSWDDSVAKAVARYETVIENYARGVRNTQHIKYDDFFSDLSKIYAGFQITKAGQYRITNKIKFRVEQLMERFDRYL